MKVIKHKKYAGHYLILNHIVRDEFGSKYHIDISRCCDNINLWQGYTGYIFTTLKEALTAIDEKWVDELTTLIEVNTTEDIVSPTELEEAINKICGNVQYGDNKMSHRETLDNSLLFLLDNPLMNNEKTLKVSEELGLTYLGDLTYLGEVYIKNIK